MYDTPIGVGGKINTNTGQVLTGSLAGQQAVDTSATTPQPISPIPNPVTSQASPIPVSSLTTPSPTPATVTPPTPSTATAGLQGAINASQDQFTQSLTDQANQAKQGFQSAQDAFTKALLGQTTQGEATNQAYAQTVDPAEKALKEINQQILADQVATRHQIEDLQKNNPEGFFGTGLQQTIQKIQDEGTRRQADLAVVQLAKQGQYDSAKAIADRAVNALIEKQKNQLQALEFNYQANKDLFTKAEQRQFETAQADRNRQLDFQQYKEKSRFDQIIKQNDPLYQAQLAKTYSDIQNSQANQTLNGKPQTAVQAQVQGYADRTNQSDIILSKLGKNFTGVTSYIGGNLPNFLKSSDRQQYEQAQRDFVNAVLRRESGAAISASEFDSAGKQYFPQPGDSQAVIDQKAANRQTVINNLYQQSNVQRATLPGQLVQGNDGKQYLVGDDGQTLLDPNTGKPI